jgi:hypothetical protein
MTATLEDFQADLAEACKEIDRLHREISALKYGDTPMTDREFVETLIKVLEWYADESNYWGEAISSDRGLSVEWDRGEKARKSLAEIKR